MAAVKDPGVPNFKTVSLRQAVQKLTFMVFNRKFAGIILPYKSVSAKR
jgi:hypothetical protein